MSPHAKNWGAKRDANELAIVHALRAIGCEVEYWDIIDLVVLDPHNNIRLIEVKKPLGPRGGGGGKLTDKQREMLGRDWPVAIVRSPQEAVDLIRGGQINADPS